MGRRLPRRIRPHVVSFGRAGVVVTAAGVLSLFLLGVGFVGNTSGSQSTVAGPAKPARVLGFLVARVPQSQQRQLAAVATAQGIYVPGVKVVLELPAGRRIASTVTDLSGRFEFRSVKQRRVRVCWRAFGFVPHCTKPFVVGPTDRFLGNQAIGVATAPKKTAFFGQARFADGSIPRTWEPMANVNAFVTVTALARNRRLAPRAYVNNYGDYILPGVRVRKTTLLRGVIEATRKSIAVGSSTPAFRRVDFKLPNSRPKLAGLVGATGGGHHWTATPGTTIDVDAVTRDPNNDVVTVRWILPDGTSSPSTVGSHSTSYTLPNRSGEYEFHAVAYDRKGGYATETVTISTNGVRFSGRVRATNAPVVPGARVEIGGRTTTTDADGRFELVVPERDRYVINISKPGYMPVSSISDVGVIGGEWTLTRASVTVEDPTRDIDVTNRRLPSDCPGSLSSQFERKGRPKECGRGIRIQIPADSLADSAGNPPAGPVEVALATVDLPAPDQMPGDYSAIDPNGNTTGMVSWGAGYVDISAGGKQYNLKPGATATVTIPIAPEQLASGAPLPNPIPLLTYDDTRGVWVSEGNAKRAGNDYVATVDHFSFVNVDIYEPNPACIRVDAVGMPPQFEIEVTGHSGGVPITKHATFENSGVRFHVIGYVPPNDPAVEIRTFVHGTTTPITLALPNPTNIQPPPTGTVLEANSGPSSAGLPPFPYTACRGFSGPSPGPLPSAVLVQASLPPNVVDEFLNFGGSAENLTANPVLQGAWQGQAQQYYNTIDPLHLRQSVGAFRSRNQFGAGEVVAAYANSADLGFGREMHCDRRVVSGLSGFDVACYVTNYGNKDSDDLDDFAQALAGKNGGVNGPHTGSIATVGMEYSRIEDPSDPTGNTFVNNTRVVKFYVWAGPPASSGNQLALSADLDGLGQRPVPQLCQVCHGGHFSGMNAGTVPNWTAPSANLHSNFIPFDLRGLTVPTLGAAEQAAFKSLNTEIVLSSEPGQAIRDVIADLYPGAAATQNQNSQVPGWSSATGSPSPHDFYRDVVAPSCRNCHNSQDTTVGTTPTSTPNDWDQASELNGLAGFAATYVCQQQVMPHALITHRRFWLSSAPHQPLLFHDYMVAHGASASSVTNCQ
jgi:hypothetical protein